ncbi:MAG: hypothetical protein M1840_001315 [Geoglossum simile]|nr:MAG: hypothetical protein M1840_001315 [Geoglossum simile]
MPTTKVPVILLKTKSTPTDGYEEYFRSAQTPDGAGFEPVFVPVLEHRYDQGNLGKVVRLVGDGGFAGEGGEGPRRYGGLIFTSQRAVEGFAGAIEAERGAGERDRLAKTPFYVVGPATFRSLSSIHGIPSTQILGAHTGNGEALAHFILTHYTALYPGEEKPPLLSLVGEQRRDIIPKTLGTNGIIVNELIVYKTGIIESFEESFKTTLLETEPTSPSGLRWVAVFSPTGCEAMLRSLHLLDPEERAQMAGRKRTAVATIGPTTRDFLRDRFGFEPDVCATTPSAEGLGDGITRFLEKSGAQEGPSGSS